MSIFKNVFKNLDQKKISKKINQEQEKKSLFDKKKIKKQDVFNKGLRNSSKGLAKLIEDLTIENTKVDNKFFEYLEEVLLSYDIGYSVVDIIIEQIKEEVKFQNIKDIKLIKEIFIDKLLIHYIQNSDIDTNINLEENRTNIVLLVGANGVGKTTSIAKISKKFKDQNKKILLVAGDTFRAGAVEQLKVWAEKLEVDIVVPQKLNQDPASVIFQGVKKGTEEDYDLVICDTSGRLQNKTNLMNELTKIRNIIKKFDDSAPHEVLLVLDATTGQSGLLQAKGFFEATKVTGIVLTKMDSTSKGGIIISINDIFKIPVKFIGLGEKIDDLHPFDLESFIIGMSQSFGE